MVQNNWKKKWSKYMVIFKDFPIKCQTLAIHKDFIGKSLNNNIKCNIFIKYVLTLSIHNFVNIQYFWTKYGAK